MISENEGGGVKGRLEVFRKLIRFGSVTRPYGEGQNVCDAVPQVNIYILNAVLGPALDGYEALCFVSTRRARNHLHPAHSQCTQCPVSTFLPL